MLLNIASTTDQNKMKMIKKLFLGVLLLSLFLVSCGPSQYVTGSYVNREALPAEPYQKIFILALGSHNTSRSVVENQLADAAQAKGFETVIGSEVLPSGFLAEKPEKQILHEEIVRSGADAVFTVALLHAETQDRYVPGTPAPMISYPFYGSYYGYYNFRYPYLYDPGYYVKENVYFIEGNLYDLKTDKLLWNLQSKSYEPANLGEFGEGYAALVMKQLQKEGWVRK